MITLPCKVSRCLFQDTQKRRPTVSGALFRSVFDILVAGMCAWLSVMVDAGCLVLPLGAWGPASAPRPREVSLARLLANSGLLGRSTARLAQRVSGLETYDWGNQ